MSGSLPGWLIDFAGWWTTARASVLIALVAAVFLATQVRQAAQDSRSRSRPIVTANLRKAPYSTGSYLLDIANSGASAARDLRVTFDPPLPEEATSPDGQQSVIPFMTARYARPIPVFPPGASLSNVYYVGRPGPGGRIVNAEKTPDKFTVTLIYRDDNRRRYTDAFPLDVDVLRKETEITSSTSPAKRQEKAYKEFSTLVGAVTALVRTLDEAVSLGVRYRSRRADRRRDAEDEKRNLGHERMTAQLLGRTPPAEGRGASLRRKIAKALHRAATRVQP